ncbi:MAG: ACT domain-containing protein [Acidobacteria bacterium]|nr:ACT domain-containing protein [Acidobacteriota bacterium]
MADTIRRVDYYYTTTADKPGEAARALAALHQAGVNLLAFTGFPQGARRSQLDFVPEDPGAFPPAAKKAGIKLSKRKTGFLIQGEDRPGAVAEVARKLSDAGINITALDAVCAGAGRYGALLWVKAADLRRAAKILGA